MSIYAAEQASSCMAYLRSAMSRHRYLFDGPVIAPVRSEDREAYAFHPKEVRERCIVALARGEHAASIAEKEGLPRRTLWAWKSAGNSGRLPKATQALWDAAAKAKQEEGE